MRLSILYGKDPAAIASRHDPLLARLFIGSEWVHLSRTEAMIIGMLMRAPGQVIPFDSIGEVIWGTSLPNAADVIRVYIHRLRTKLESSDARIITLPGKGYMIELKL